MAVWGIGAYFPEAEGDITKQCLNEEVAVIGFSVEEKPKYYEMLQSVEVGDLIFIKSRFMLNQPLRVKAIGIVKDSKIETIPNVYHAKGIKVHWLEDFSDVPIQIEKSRERDGDTHAIYQEKNEEVIKQIIELL